LRPEKLGNKSNFTNTNERVRDVVKDRIPEKWRYGMIDRNYTPFQSNVLCQRGMYLAIVERRLW